MLSAVPLVLGVQFKESEMDCRALFISPLRTLRTLFKNILP